MSEPATIDYRFKPANKFSMIFSPKMTFSAKVSFWARKLFKMIWLKIRISKHLRFENNARPFCQCKKQCIQAALFPVFLQGIQEIMQPYCMFRALCCVVVRNAAKRAVKLRWAFPYLFAAYIPCKKVRKTASSVALLHCMKLCAAIF